ncbi:uncharacterized protein PAC_16055 [Phialocephala subalpina]|uniref:DUF4484 domain-containing protein n=1 Tax=Phialocephala subalpina TaxID=576137 RepID=A0A1L7XMB5_9HELO|nr:uncharacterized protein PAC_16055 [Phialocephala subalpina]
MAAARRGQGPLNLDLPNGTTSELPPLAALFFIYFDIKAGYTIGWKRSLPGIELEGVVEYKSLPSGLHTVKEDLIYFVHENHAGLSAFVNAPAAEESRNARMIAVGVMVPLSYGRLGRSWKHAKKLKEMASELIIDTSKTKVLEEYWEEHKAQGPAPVADTDSLLDSPSSIRFKPILTTPSKPRGHNRNRSASDGTALLPPGHTLSTYHPARSLLRLLEVFGPLIFPIHRAALLRKRILITAHAPVQDICNFVYDISVLSNIPLAVTDLLSSTAPPTRLRPLFTIGVHDIPLLEADLLASKQPPTSSPGSTLTESEDPGHGWIACTTDSILAMKNTLYDVLITMPPPYSEDANQKIWPKVESSKGVEMKATQRDLRRFQTLRWGLSRASPPASRDGDAEPVRATSSSTSIHKETLLDIPDTDNIIEPLSWSALAYSGFMWWASAGEQRLHSEEETEADSQLLAGLSLSTSSPSTPRPRSYSSSSQSNTKGKINGAMQEGEAQQEMALIAYFHRLTTQILSTLSDIVDATDSDDEREDDRSPLHPHSAEECEGEGEEESGPAMYVTSQDMMRMGLDEWSVGDHEFMEEVCKAYFGRKAKVEGRNVDVCGIRVC